MVFSLGGLGWLLVQSSFLDVDQIQIEGARRVLPEQVVEIAAREMGRPLLLVDRGGISDQVEQLPWVLRASTRWSLPGTLVVKVTEREPVAWVEVPETEPSGGSAASGTAEVGSGDEPGAAGTAPAGSESTPAVLGEGAAPAPDPSAEDPDEEDVSDEEDVDGDAQVALVDDTGRVLTWRSQPPEPLLRLAFEGEVPEPGGAIEGAGDGLAIAAAVPDELRSRVHAVTESDDGFEIDLEGAELVRFGPPTDIAAKWAGLLAVVEELGDRSVFLIDVRVPSAPSVREQEELPQPEPEREPEADSDDSDDTAEPPAGADPVETPAEDPGVGTGE